MRISIPHRFRFSRAYDLTRHSDWDSLRLDDDGPFALPTADAAWLALSQEPGIVARARVLDQFLDGVDAIASYGVGTAATERALHRLRPSRRIVLTEFAPRTVEELVRLFPEATVMQHDLRVEDPVVGVDVHLLLRIDTELDDEQFRAVLERFRQVRVLVVVTELLDVRAAVRELATWARGGSVRAGRVRSKAAFVDLLRATHDVRSVQVHDLSAWLLEPRGSQID
jgi:hypothetical protein